MVSQVEEHMPRTFEDKYFLYKTIGEGGSSKVYLGKKIKDVKEEVAIKISKRLHQ